MQSDPEITEAEEDTEDLPEPIEIVSYRTPTGQDVVISREALTAYGKDYIDQLALSSGKNKLVLADKYVLQDAKNNFPDSDAPMIEMYRDYLIDAEDVISAYQKKSVSKDTIFDELTGTDKRINANIENSIKTNNVEVRSQPHGDAGMIIIPSPESLKDDSFKNYMIEWLSSVDKNKFKNIPGTSLDWAKLALVHETAHLRYKDTDNQFDQLIDYITKGSINSEKIQFARDSLGRETTADLDASINFNRVSASAPNISQSFADIRVINSFVRNHDVINYEYNNMDDHNTGAVFTNHLAGKENGPINPDKIQFSTAYTNTLVKGFIGAIEGEDYLKKSAVNSYIGIHENSPFNGTLDKSIDQQGYKSAIKGDDPMRISSLGTMISSGNPEKLYASTKVLYENGAFDHAPDAKQNAKRFLESVERSAPGMIDNKLIDDYRKAWENPDNQNYIGQLHRYYDENPQMGRLLQPGPQTVPPHGAP